MVACERKADRVTVEETRVLTTKDRTPKLFATSDERFRDAKPSPVRGSAPEHWLTLPSAQFRELNYRFGETGMGEVYVSLSAGTVADNVNRWLGQFGKPPLNQVDLAALEKIEIAGVEGVWVEAAGDYQAAGGMGMPVAGEGKPGFGLAGVIAEVDGRILTVKMVGPQAEVEKETGALRAFAASVELVK
jgi:hypothetical protein